jgi:hypothetical protein
VWDSLAAQLLHPERPGCHNQVCYAKQVCFFVFYIGFAHLPSFRHARMELGAKPSIRLQYTGQQLLRAYKKLQTMSDIGNFSVPATISHHRL